MKKLLLATTFQNWRRQPPVNGLSSSNAYSQMFLAMLASTSLHYATRANFRAFCFWPVGSNRLRRMMPVCVTVHDASGASIPHPRIIFPAGTYDADRNPSRITSRNLFDVDFGADSLCNKDALSLGAQFAVANLADKSALYNFLSSFSGTNFLIRFRAG